MVSSAGSASYYGVLTGFLPGDISESLESILKRCLSACRSIFVGSAFGETKPVLDCFVMDSRAMVVSPAYFSCKRRRILFASDKKAGL